MWSFTFYRYFLKRKTQFNQRVVLKVLNSAPLLTILLNLTFPSASFLVWSLESCLKTRALLLFIVKELCWERGTIWIWNEW